MPNPNPTTAQVENARYAVDGIAEALSRVAGSLEEDAARLRSFVAEIRETDPAMFVDSALDSNVATLVMRTMNTSSIVAPAESAIYNAGRAVQGR